MDRGFQFEAAGDTFLFHTGKRVKPQETRDLMQQAIEIHRLLVSGVEVQEQ